MELPSYFADFLKEIRPTASQIEEYKRGHRTLRDRLENDEILSPLIVSTFLQGSYRRATAIRPQGEKRADVDIIVVTKLSKDEYTDPTKAMDIFLKFLKKYYEGKYVPQGRSFGINMQYVDLDLVITAAPSESEIGIYKSESVISEDTPEELSETLATESALQKDKSNSQILLDSAREKAEWQISPLYIPDRDTKCWDPTHPLMQIEWTWRKNALCNTHYINVVKAIKWWRRVNHSTPKYPKGYPVEHLIGQCCPDGITSVATGVTLTLETIAKNYQSSALLNQSPVLPDHGVPEHNVFARVSGEDFAEFHKQICKAAEIARQALEASSVRESAEKWRLLFGNKFPEAPPNKDGDDGGNGGSKKGGYTPRTEVSNVGGGRFA